MKTSVNHWRRYWNARGSANFSDDKADRGTTCLCPEIVQRTERQFLNSIDQKPNELLFDAGCGTGANLGKFSPLVRAIVGFDISDQMINRAKKRIMREELSNVRLMIGTISNVGVKNDTFHKIICTSVLQYLDDEECEAALKELFRISRHNGIVVLHVKNLSSLYGCTLYFAKKIARLIKKPVTPDYYRTNIWYERTISKLGARIVDYDSFGVFHISHLPKFALYSLLKLETKIPKGKFLRRRGVNYQITVKTDKTTK